MDTEVSNSKIYGKSIILASIQIALVSVEMSGRFQVISSKDQETLDNAGDMLRIYMVTGIIWTIASMILMHSFYGKRALMPVLIANIVVMIWMYYSYMITFRIVADRYGLKMPKVLNRFRGQ